MATKRKLGKGLGSIITSSPAPVADFERAIVDNAEFVIELDITSIVPNPNQPRKYFDEAKIKELSENINEVGLIQPITVRKYNNGYAIIAGERRFRATKLLGHSKIRAIVMEANEEKNVTIALIENIQRENLDPVEEAKAYRMLSESFGLKQEDIAKRVGKERASISNSIRLLNLPEHILASLSNGDISAGHAKLLLSVPKESLNEYFETVIQQKLSVHSLDELIKENKAAKISGKKTDASKTPSTKQKNKSAQTKQIESKLRLSLGTKVEVKGSGAKGKIEISYYTPDDFDRIIELISKKN